MVPARFTFTYRLRQELDEDENDEKYAYSDENDNDEEKTDKAVNNNDTYDNARIDEANCVTHAIETIRKAAGARQIAGKRSAVSPWQWVITHHHSSGMPSQPHALGRIAEAQ